MVEKIIPGKPNDSLSLSKTEPTLKSSERSDGLIKISSEDGWEEYLLTLAEIHGQSLSKMAQIMYKASTSDLTFEQRSRGATWLLRNAKFFPSPVENREACTGIPGGSTTIAAAISTEAKRFWGWMIKWTPRLVEGYMFELTIAPYSGAPVTHKFAARSLFTGLVPYMVQPHNVKDEDIDQRRHELRLAEAGRDAYERFGGENEESRKQWDSSQLIGHPLIEAPLRRRTASSPSSGIVLGYVGDPGSPLSFGTLKPGDRSLTQRTRSWQDELDVG
jgi:hypothetical protein